MQEEFTAIQTVSFQEVYFLSQSSKPIFTQKSSLDIPLLDHTIRDFKNSYYWTPK